MNRKELVNTEVGIKLLIVDLEKWIIEAEAGANLYRKLNNITSVHYTQGRVNAYRECLKRLEKLT